MHLEGVSGLVFGASDLPRAKRDPERNIVLATVNVKRAKRITLPITSMEWDPVTRFN